MTNDESTHPRDNAKASRIAALVDDVRMARIAGKDVDDEGIIRAYPDLMPELGAELVKLKRIEAARQAADQKPDVTVDSGAELPAGTRTADEAPEPAASSPRIFVQAPGYSILREVNRGGQAVVFQAIQLSTGRKVALKVMRDGPLANERALARFKREVGVLAALNHPNIVTIFDTGQTLDGSRYMAMDFIGGRSLDQYVKDRQRKNEQDPSWLLRLFLKICAAVSAAHLRGVVHRDLKPSNIQIDDRGEPHILDFGLARTALDIIAQNGNEPLSITGEFLGSLPWSSPEQAEGDPDKIDIRTDVYSLGVILYQMITGGHFPYEVVGNIRDILNNILTVEPMPPSKIFAATKDRRTVPTRLPLVNEAIEKIVLKSLAKRREERYQSAAELGRDIKNYLSGQQTIAPASDEVSNPIPSGRQQRSNLRWIWGAVAICVVAVAGLYVFHVNRQDQIATVATQPTDSAGQSAANVQASVGRHINLLSLVDSEKDAVSGTWKMLDGNLVSLQPGHPRSKIQFPYAPPKEYDYRVEFVRTRGEMGMAFVCAGPTGHPFLWNISGGRTTCAIGLIDGGDMRSQHNPTCKRSDHWIDNGQVYSTTVKVRVDRVDAYLNDKLITSYNSDYSHLSTGPLDALRDETAIGLALVPCDISIRSAEIIEVTGQGHILPHGNGATPNSQPLEVQTSHDQDAPPASSPTATEPAPAVLATIPAGAAAFDGHHFKLITGSFSWNAAQQQCAQMGGHLAKIKDERAADFLQTLKGNSTIAWVGGTADASGNWTWIDGTPILASQIATDQEHPEYRWLFLNSRGKLSTRPQDGHIDWAAYPSVQGFICEWDQ